MRECPVLSAAQAVRRTHGWIDVQNLSACGSRWRLRISGRFRERDAPPTALVRQLGQHHPRSRPCRPSTPATRALDRDPQAVPQRGSQRLQFRGLARSRIAAHALCVAWANRTVSSVRGAVALRHCLCRAQARSLVISIRLTFVRWQMVLRRRVVIYSSGS